MGLPSHPTYYRDHPRAEPQRRLRELVGGMLGAGALSADLPLRSLLLNNVSNADRLDYLRRLAKRGTRVQYLARGVKPKAPPFTHATVEILAPEKDVSVYYAAGRVRSLAAAARVEAGEPRGGDWWEFPKARRVPAPTNLGESEWIALRDAIKGGGAASARFIDRAQNNTSLCFVLTAAGKRLLFPGDAELESWAMIAEKCPDALAPVDFLKVSHHGSRNGTPLDLLDRLLPRSRKGKAVAIVSTKQGVYGTEQPVPDADVLGELAARCREVQSTDGRTEPYVTVEV